MRDKIWIRFGFVSSSCRRLDFRFRGFRFRRLLGDGSFSVLLSSKIPAFCSSSDECVDGANVDVTGIADSEVSGLKIAQAAGLVETVDGPVILIMSQYAVLGSGKTVHSKGQMEHFGVVIDDRSRRNGGAQCMVTTEGYVVPISIRDGLPRIDMRPPSQAELDKYPHVFVTSDSPWDPAILDEEFDETFHDAVMELPVVVERQAQRDPRVDEYGFLRRTQQDYALLFDAQDEFIEANGRPDVVITDPPRVGMHEKVVKQLLKLAPERIVYVSCHPATQARDLALMKDAYQIDKVQPVDMFPHTYHVENVVQLTRK